MFPWKNAGAPPSIYFTSWPPKKPHAPNTSPQGSGWSTFSTFSRSGFLIWRGDPGNAFHATQVLQVAAKVPATVVPLSSEEGISTSDAEGYLVCLLDEKIGPKW